MLNLGVTNRRLTYRTEIDDLIALVDIALVIQIDKDFFNCLRAALVHCETFPIPIGRRANLLKLIDNPCAVLILPFPAFLKKAVSTELILVQSLLLKMLNNLNLSRNCGVVYTRLPKGIVPLHLLITNKDILHSIVKRMSHMKLPRNIRRRHYYSERLLILINLDMKISVIFPFLI